MIYLKSTYQGFILQYLLIYKPGVCHGVPWYPLLHAGRASPVREPPGYLVYFQVLTARANNTRSFNTPHTYGPASITPHEQLLE